ncbi:MAG: ABC transporter substrate-binding protein [Limnochordia bacterium]
MEIKVRRLVFFMCLALLIHVPVYAMTEIRVLEFRSSPEWIEFYSQWAAEEFAKTRPGVKVTHEFLPFGAAREKLLVSLAAGVPPNVMRVSSVWAGEFIGGGLLEPWTSQDLSGVDLRTTIPYALQQATSGGTLYGLPIAIDAISIFYNQQIFGQSGLDSAPEAIRNWDDLRSYAAKMTQRDAQGQISQYGFVTRPHYQNLMAFLVSNNSNFLNEDETEAVFNTPAGFEAVDFMSHLMTNYGHRSRAMGQDLFVAGKSAMHVQSVQTAPTFQLQNPSLDFGVTSIPVGPRGSQRGSVVWAHFYSVPVGASDQELAKEYAKFMHSLPIQAEALGQIGVLESPRMDITKTAPFAAMRRESPWAEYIPTVFSVAKPDLTTDRLQDVTRIVTNRIYPALLGEAPLSLSVLDDIARQINTVLQ